uniref:RNase H type-1 domain-containing protein n=2 Tax=Brassica oleracea TaxID=3712 RepID=A0A0D3D733_BRAOL|nr:unnamed protein product [Brassica oleracea]
MKSSLEEATKKKKKKEKKKKKAWSASKKEQEKDQHGQQEVKGILVDAYNSKHNHDLIYSKTHIPPNLGNIPISIPKLVLQRRGVTVEGLCPHCNEEETAIHLFFLCPYAKKAWEQAPPQSLQNWESNVAPPGNHHFFEPGLPSSDGNHCSIAPMDLMEPMISFSVVSNAVLGAREWELAQGDLRGTVASTTRAELQLPIPSDCSIVNCDASWLSESFSAGLGWLIEEKQSGVTTEFQARAEYVASPLMAEALALREALTTVRQHRCSNVWIRSDNLELIRAINSKAFPMELFGVLKDIEFLSQFLDFICFTHVSRSYNGRVDSLAKSAHHLASPALY